MNTKLDKIKPAIKPGTHSDINSPFNFSEVNKILSLLLKMQTMTKNQIINYQIKKLNLLIKHSLKNVPLYADLYKNFKISNFNKLSDLSVLPFTSKNLLQKSGWNRVDKRLRPSDLCYITTGGSSGDPFKVIMDTSFRSQSHAVTKYYLKVAGEELGMSRHIRLHGNIIDNSVLDKNIFWIEEKNRLTMSVYHINKQNINKYVNIINDYKPRYIHAYSSALYLLAKIIHELDLKITTKVDKIFFDSETLFDWQKKLIQKVFKSKIFNIYGHTEGAVAAITFPNSSILESIPYLGIIEIIGDKGQVLTKPGSKGEIVVTGLNNYSSPLIRYRTGDFAIICNRGKSNFPTKLSKVYGRVQDFLISNTNQLIPLAPILFDYNIDWSGILNFQIVQKKPGRIIFYYVPISSDLDSFFNNFQSVFKNFFKVKFVKVNKIKNTIIGKQKYINQYLNVSEFK